MYTKIKTSYWHSNVVGVDSYMAFQEPLSIMLRDLSRYDASSGLYQILYIPDSAKVDLQSLPIINEYTIYVGMSNSECGYSSLSHRVSKFRSTLLALAGYGRMNTNIKRNVHAGAKKFYEDHLMAEFDGDQHKAYQAVYDDLYFMMACDGVNGSVEFPTRTYESALLAEYFKKNRYQLCNDQY